jgi:hypothetical protein
MDGKDMEEGVLDGQEIEEHKHSGIHEQGFYHLHAHPHDQLYGAPDYVHHAPLHELTLPPLTQLPARDPHAGGSEQAGSSLGTHEAGGRWLQNDSQAPVFAPGKRKLNRGPDGRFETKSNIHARKKGRFANAHGISQHSLTEQAIRPLMRFCQDTAAEYLQVSTNTLSKACARLKIKWPRRPEVPTPERQRMQNRKKQKRDKIPVEILKSLCLIFTPTRLGH